MGPAAGSGFLHQGLVGDGQAQLDIRLDLPGMEGGVKQPELNGSLGKHAVQIQRMVAAGIIVDVPVGLSVVPQPLQLCHGLGPLPVDLIQETQIGFLTVVLPANLNLQGLV